jgi:hypothetical protein
MRALSPTRAQGALAHLRQDLFVLRVAAPALLGEHEIAVDHDLEDAPFRGYERELRDARLELLQQPLRQTDGSGSVASALAVLDGDLHGQPSLARACLANGELLGGEPLRS